MQQLVLELATPERASLANFLPGRNAELVSMLARFVTGAQGEIGMLIWGAADAGKTHLLRAAVELAREHAIPARMFAHPGEFDVASTSDELQLICIDAIDEADSDAAARIFTLYNTLLQRGGRLLAASRSPLASLRLREDLRTRLGWGLVYELFALSDDEKPPALAAYARQGGFVLSAELIVYLLRHGRRDMGSLLSALAALDRVSLATKRPITVPLLRDWLQGELDWAAHGATGNG
jgi:DnaA family protein